MLTLTTAFFFASGFLSAWLSFGIAYLMARSWRTIGSSYVLGFPVGFSLLAFSYLSLDISYVLQFANTIYLTLGSSGFAFLALTYVLRGKPSVFSGVRSSRRSSSIFAAIAAVAMGLLVLSVAYIVGLLRADAIFRIANLVFLGYIIFKLNQALKTEVELSNVVLGFTFLAIDQYSLLLWALDPSFLWSLVFAQLVRVAGLIVLAVFLVRGFQRA